MELTGSSAVVTGAASGLGAATAAALAGPGWRWSGIDLAAAWDRAAGPAGRGHRRVRRRHLPDGRAGGRRCWRSAAGPLRIAVNCAGIGTAGRILSRSGVHDLALFARVIRVNLVGTFNVLRLAAAAMAAHRPGRRRTASAA